MKTLWIAFTLTIVLSSCQKEESGKKVAAIKVKQDSADNQALDPLDQKIISTWDGNKDYGHSIYHIETHQ